jgi:ATP-binding cassette subfamily B protein
VEDTAVKNQARDPRLPTDARLLKFSGRPLAFLMHFILRHRFLHIVVLTSMLLAVMCSVGTQYGLKHLIDVVAQGPGADTANAVWGAFLLLCVLICGDNMLWRVGGWAAARVFVQVTGDVRRDLFAHLTGHSPSYFAERLPGTLASRITATSNAIFQLENTGAWNVLPPCIAVVSSIVLITSVNWMMAAALVAASAALATLIFRLAHNGTPLHRQFATKAAGVDGELVDIISNMGVVRAFGATWRERDRVSATIQDELGARRTSLIYLEKLRLIHAGVTVILTAGLVAWEVLAWRAGRATAGDMVLVTSLGFTILHSTRDLAVALVDLTQHVARLDEAVATLLVPHDLPDASGARVLQGGLGRVAFHDVHFAYPGRPAVLNGLDLVIEPGQRVGLVGASGAGKSTVLALLQRFYDTQGGSVTIEGQDIRGITQQSLREMLAVVPQDISLFHRSVLENIRYARPDATTEEVMEAASIARCRDFIAALPEGFDTIVGDRGTKLSGGQRQRIAIARALLKDAPVLLLDEATSALDSESEQEIQRALDTLMQGRTVIAIAHRLSTLQNFDRIVVMDAGRVIDDGPPEVLAARPGPYRDLLRRQAYGSEKLAA